MFIIRNQKAQAIIEYLIVFLFITSISVLFIGKFRDFLKDSLGNVGHVLSMNLTVGVCPEKCFFKGYANGYSGQ